MTLHASSTPPAARPGAFPLASSGRESDEDYRAIVCRLNARWRVIECRDRIQWIVQCAKRSGHRMAWRGRSYCRTRSALIRACAQSAGEIEPLSLANLHQLPERYGRQP